MNHFFALDVETANIDMASICQMGLVEFSDGKLVKQWGNYINPECYFDAFNIGIHGITPDMVKKSPLFPEAIRDVQKIVKNSIVVTHTTFDQNAIMFACQKYKLPEMSFTWLDSARIVRRHWGLFRNSGYGLQDVANHLGIVYKAHDAMDDARAAGEVVIKALAESGQTVEEWIVRAYKKVPHDKYSVAHEGNPDGPFYGETIVFTGTLQMPRREAAQLAAAEGCAVGDNVTSKTTILVVGLQDFEKLAGFDKSSKHRKTESLIEQGQQIRIITENDFLKMVKISTAETIELLHLQIEF